MEDTIVVIVLLILSIIVFIISVRSFREKGFLFNNAYLLASEQERERLNKKPYYRQTGIVFLLIGILFVLNAVEVFLNTGWIYYIIAVVVIGTIIYAIVSGIKIESQD